MSAALILGLVGALLILAFVANRVFRLTRIPDVVVLMALGVLLGPGLGLFNLASLSKATNLLGTLAIILVLFEGGLELDLRDTLRHFPGGLLLACVAFSFSLGLVALIVSKGLGLPLTTGLLVGAVLGCTSSTVVLPVLQQMEAEEPVKATLTLEASLGDVLAVLTVSLLLGLKGGGDPIAIGLAHGVLTQVGVALLFAVTGGILWSRLLPVLSEQRFWQVLTFSIVLVLYAGMEALGANGLIAVLGFGMTLSNFPGVDPRSALAQSIDPVDSQQALLTFHSELAFLVRTFFFVLIGAVAELGSFRQHPLLMAGTVAALFLARWLAVQASAWSWRGFDARGRDVILWMLPRGLITVVLAIEVAQARGSEVSFLPGLAFAVILATNLMVVLGSVVTAPKATAEETASQSAEAMQVSDGDAGPPESAPPGRRSRRWILDAVMLVLLTISGIVLWYSNQSPEFRSKGLEHWVRVHVQRQR
jgi:cell volume regulation protein A